MLQVVVETDSNDAAWEETDPVAAAHMGSGSDRPAGPVDEGRHNRPVAIAAAGILWAACSLGSDGLSPVSEMSPSGTPSGWRGVWVTGSAPRSHLSLVQAAAG